MFTTNATENSGRPFIHYEGFENKLRTPMFCLETNDVKTSYNLWEHIIKELLMKNRFN